jgi:adenine-specific DNA-methyltransferase
LDDYLKYSGQVDSEGIKLSTNTETDGRFHSKWLSMMYPRLFLARNLLKDDGVILVSIDDHEFHNLRSLMNDILGEENFVASIIWKKKYGGGAKTKYYVDLHEYVICYAKNITTIENIEIPYNDELVAKYYKFRDDKYEVRGPYRLQPLATNSNDERPNLRYPIIHNGEEIWPEMQWQWAKDRTELAQKNNELVIVSGKGKTSVNFKQYLKDESGEVRTNKPFSIIEGLYTQHGTSEISEILGNGKVFPFPKPSKLIKELLTPFLKTNDMILDFFAGSGSTAHAVLDMNSEDGGTRKFILVQLPEPTEQEDYSTITEITKERVRRVIKKLNEDEAKELDFGGQKQDRGFKVFKLSSSNFKVWDGTKAAEKSEGIAEQLRMLYEIILKAGLPLTAPVTKATAANQEIYSVNGGQLLVCLEESVGQDTIRGMLALQPQQVVCLDEAFHGNDMLKTNTVLEMKSHGIGFRTV